MQLIGEVTLSRLKNLLGVFVVASSCLIATHARAAADVDPPSTSVCTTQTFPPADPGSTPFTPGKWWNPNRSGTGWDLHQTDDNNSLYLTWYTFRPGGWPIVLESDPAGINRSAGEWESDLLEYTWNGTGVNRPGTRVGSVAIKFFPDDPTRAAIRWQWDAAGQGYFDECIYDLFRNSGGTGPRPQTFANVNATDTGTWYEPNYSGYGVQVTIGQIFVDHGPSKYQELDALAIYDTANKSVWVQGLSENASTPPPMGTQRTLQLYYVKGTYPGGVPTGNCPSAPCYEVYNGVGNFTRTFTSDATADAKIDVSADSTKLHGGTPINWKRPPTGSGTVQLLKLTGGSTILVDQINCIAYREEGQTACPITVNWDAFNSSEMPYRRDLVTDQLTQISTATQGELVDWLTPGAKVRYELRTATYVRATTPTVRALWSTYANQVPDQTPIAVNGPGTHDPGVGATLGTGAVSGGAAAYEIPISIPPGRRGVEPKLSLAYNSRSGNGIAGVGWSLTGLSSIQRCPSTVAQDDTASAILFSSTDKLCLNGRRLVLTTGSPASYGLQNAVYRTEIDSFVRVTQLGGDLAASSNSTYFKVETKAGDIEYYGGNSTGASAARVVLGGHSYPLTWMVSRREDRLGNYVSYTYRNNLGDGEVLIDYIEYTGISNQSLVRLPSRKVSFGYASRTADTAKGAGTSIGPADITSSYLAGGLQRQTQLLSDITTSVSGSTVRKYTLGYGAYPATAPSDSQSTGRGLLRWVQECGYATGQATACRTETTVAWQEAKPVFRLSNPTLPAALKGGQVNPQTGDGQQIPDNSKLPLARTDIRPVGDYDGDGTREVLWTVPDVTNPDVSVTYLASFGANRAIKWQVPLPSDAFKTTLLNNPLANVDFDGDGRTDLLRYNAATGTLSVQFWAGVSQPTSFATAFGTAQVTNVPYNLVGDITTADELLYSGDINGDGRADLVVVGPGDGSTCVGTRRIKAYLNTATTFSPGTVSLNSTPISYCLAKATFPEGPKYETVSRVADFNGDGVPDFLIVSKPSTYLGAGTFDRVVYGRRSGGAFTFNSAANGSFPGLFAGGQTSEESTGVFLLWMDVNGDGFDDYVYRHVQLNNGVCTVSWALRLFTGTGFTAPFNTDGNAFSSSQSGCTQLVTYHYASMTRPIDYDGDGRTDLTVPESFAVRLCSWHKVDIHNGSCGHTTGPKSLPQCSDEEFFYCPEIPRADQMGPSSPDFATAQFGMDANPADGNLDAVGGAFTLSDTVNVVGLYANGKDGLDDSLYNLKVIRFVESGSGATRKFVAREITNTGIVGGNHGWGFDDLYGDGLADSWSYSGCAYTDPNQCLVPLVGNGQPISAQNSPTSLPNGVPLLSRLLLNENRGIGGTRNTPYAGDMASGVTDGLLRTTQWVYYPISSDADRTAGTPFYQVSPTGCDNSDGRHICFSSSMQAVSAMSSSDGLGSTRVTNYGYERAVFNTQGRGFQGFRRIIEEDASTSLRMSTWFEQRFPLAGNVLKVETNSLSKAATDPATIPVGNPTLMSSSKDPIQREVYTWRCDTALRTDAGACGSRFGNAGVRFPYLDSKETWSYDATTAVSGTYNNSAIRHVLETNFPETNPTNASGVDVYGNTRDSVVVTDDGAAGGVDGFQRFIQQHKRSVHRDYATDTPTLDAWWISKLNTEQITTSETYDSSAPVGYPSPALPAGVSSPTYVITNTFAWNPDRTALSEDVTRESTNTGVTTTTYGYPAASSNYGLPTSVSVVVPPSSLARTTTTTYSSDGYFPTSVSNPLGQPTYVSIRARDGQPDSSTDLNGRFTSYTYDVFGLATTTKFLSWDPASTSTPPTSLLPDKLVATASCDASCPALAVRKTTEVQEGSPTITTYFDQLDRAIRVERMLSSGTTGTTEIVSISETGYNSRGLKALERGPYLVGQTAPETQYPSFDVLGRPLLKRTIKGTDLPGNDEGNLETTYAYSGRKITIKVQGSGYTCPSSTHKCLTMARFTDAFGRVAYTLDANDVPGPGLTQTWYDANDKVIGIKDALGNVTSATYNSIGQRKTLVDPNMGTTTSSYNGVGELVSETDGRGIQSSYTYDMLGRKTVRTANADVTGDGIADSVTDTWTYDPARARGELAAQVRKLPSANNIVLRAESYEFDANGRKVKTYVTQYNGSNPPENYAHEWAYDSRYGRLKAEMYPSGDVRQIKYTRYGQAKTDIDFLTNLTLRDVTSFNSKGEALTETYGNGVDVTRTFATVTTQLADVNYTKFGASIRKLSYFYDVFGNLSRQELNNTSATPTVEGFQYDNLFRLTSATQTGAASGSVSYSYDAVGNVKSKSDFGSVYTYSNGTCGGGPNAVKNVTLAGGGSRVYCYDGGGNLKSYKNGTTQSQEFLAYYGLDNLPSYIERTAQGTNDRIYYTPDGKKAREIGTEGTRIHVGGDFEDLVGVREQAYLGDYAVLTRTAAGVRRIDWLLKDRLGSVDAVVDNNGTVSETRGYDAFGTPRQGSWATATMSPPQLQTTATTPHGFTGHQHLNDVQIIHMGGRAYDYQLGRFLSVDPVVQFPTNSQSYNAYSYILNNPLSGTDPTGFLSSICDHPSASSSPGSCGLDLPNLGAAFITEGRKLELIRNGLLVPGARANQSASTPSLQGSGGCAVPALCASVFAAAATKVPIYSNPTTGGIIEVDPAGAPNEQKFVDDAKKVIADAVRLNQTKVLEDATATPSGGAVTVTLTYTTGATRHVLTDTGTTTQTVQFNPRGALETTGRPKRYQSPAAGLIHELGHAAVANQYGNYSGMLAAGLLNQTITPMSGTKTFEVIRKVEDDIITRYERPYTEAAKDRHEFSRTDYFTTVRPVDNNCGVLCPRL